MNIVTNNIQGMCNAKKQRDLISILKMSKPSVMCIQETNLNPAVHKLPSLPDYTCYYSASTKAFSGTCILVLSSLNVMSNTVISEGSAQCVTIKLDHDSIHILNVHLPHSHNDAMQLLNKLEMLLSKIPSDERVFMAGDWNFVENDLSDRDRVRSKERRKLVVSKMKSILDSYSLIDFYRVLYPSGTDMTHVGSHPHKPAARLDRIYVSSALSNELISHKILPSASDHAQVQVTWARKVNCTTQLWKLDNNSVNP